MLNNKFASIGIIAVIVLAVIYLGNLAMKTTPDSDAGGVYQYKVMSISECQSKVGDMWFDCVEQKLNDTGKDGWELVQSFGENSAFPTFIFKKK